MRTAVDAGTPAAAVGLLRHFAGTEAGSGEERVSTLIRVFHRFPPAEEDMASLEQAVARGRCDAVEGACAGAVLFAMWAAADGAPPRRRARRARSHPALHAV